MSKTRTWLVWAALGSCLGVQVASPQAARSQPQPSSGVATVAPDRALLNKFCVTCHNQRTRTAGLMLDKLDVQDIGAGAETWEKVLRKVRTGTMPPAGMPRPEPSALETLASSLEVELDKAAAAKPNSGRVPIHRLNRTEYTNAIRDLLGITIDGRTLLVADDVDQYGFDNIAGSLPVSPVLLEGYMSAARKISRLAVGDPKSVPVFETFDVPTGPQDERMSEDLPFGSRGGTVIHYRFPIDGEYVVKIRLRRSVYGYIFGLGEAHQLEVRLNNKRIKLFRIGGEAPPKGSPASFAGAMMGDPAWDFYMQNADADLEVRFPAKADTGMIAVSFVKDIVESESIPQPFEARHNPQDEMYSGIPVISHVLVGGPYNPQGPGESASRRAIFVCRPANQAVERACAKRILSRLSRRAYRRPVTDQEIQTLLKFYDAGQRDGGFEGGIRLGLQRILADLNFLFRLESDPPTAAPSTIYRLSDLELASRLSFFLWSSIPDDELLDLAIQNKLKDPSVLEKQVRRMLADARSTALVENFATAWLGLRKLRSAAPDPGLFADFDETLRQDLQRETQLFIESELRADHSIVNLLSANYTLVNERLAKHYGIGNVYGSHFRRVTVNSEERGGLLGQGSILTATSYPNRTSPVLRGKWLLDNILGMPPPPPPPNVPVLKESTAGNATSVRARMEEHRKNPACAVCHVRMDPLGFALENFDPIGKWRTTSDGLPVDVSATLPNGAKFQGVAGLKTLLASQPQQFVNLFTEKLLTYALGREVEYYDFPTIRKITREAATSDYRWSAIITEIVKSSPFQMSITQSTTPQKEVAFQKPPVQKPAEIDQIRTSIK